MSFANLSGEELLNSLENHYKGNMPPECLEGFKRFTLCKLNRDEEIKNTKGFAYFQDYLTTPFSRVEGCRTEYDNFHKCYFDFMYRYYDMKKYVSQINGETPKYTRKKFENEIKLNNLGLNKF